MIYLFTDTFNIVLIYYFINIFEKLINYIINLLNFNSFLMAIAYSNPIENLNNSFFLLIYLFLIFLILLNIKQNLMKKLYNFISYYYLNETFNEKAKNNDLSTIKNNVSLFQNKKENLVSSNTNTVYNYSNNSLFFNESKMDDDIFFLNIYLNNINRIRRSKYSNSINSRNAVAHTRVLGKGNGRFLYSNGFNRYCSSNPNDDNNKNNYIKNMYKLKNLIFKLNKLNKNLNIFFRCLKIYKIVSNVTLFSYFKMYPSQKLIFDKLHIKFKKKYLFSNPQNFLFFTVFFMRIKEFLIKLNYLSLLKIIEILFILLSVLFIVQILL